MTNNLTNLPLTKLEELRSSHTSEMQRREISDNFYFTGGRYDQDRATLQTLDAAINQKKEMENNK